MRGNFREFVTRRGVRLPVIKKPLPDSMTLREATRHFHVHDTKIWDLIDKEGVRAAYYRFPAPKQGYCIQVVTDDLARALRCRPTLKKTRQLGAPPPDGAPLDVLANDLKKPRDSLHHWSTMSKQPILGYPVRCGIGPYPSPRKGGTIWQVRGLLMSRKDATICVRAAEAAEMVATSWPPSITLRFPGNPGVWTGPGIFLRDPKSVEPSGREETHAEREYLTESAAEKEYGLTPDTLRLPAYRWIERLTVAWPTGRSLTRVVRQRASLDRLAQKRNGKEGEDGEWEKDSAIWADRRGLWLTWLHLLAKVNKHRKRSNLKELKPHRLRYLLRCVEIRGNYKLVPRDRGRSSVGVLHQDDPDVRRVLGLPELLASNIVVETGETTGTKASAEQPTASHATPALLSHGNRFYSTPNSPAVQVAPSYHAVLQVFLQNGGFADKPTLAGVCDNPSFILKLLSDRYPQFQPFISRPGGKHRGGYRVQIRQAVPSSDPLG